MSDQVQASIKPRIAYAAFQAALQQDVPAGITLAGLIEKYIAEMDGTPERPGVKPLGESHRLTLRVIGRMAIGRKVASALAKQDFLSMCEELKARGLAPATAGQYLCYTSGLLKYAPSRWQEHEDVSPGALEAAKPYLIKHGFVGTSTPREERPTPEQIGTLLAHFEESNKRKRTKVDMALITLWQWYSARRIGETCRLLWSDWDRENHTILVRKIKDPRNRNKNKVCALTPEAQALLVAMWDVRDPNEPRIFPYNKCTCVKRYVDAKHRTGITNLRMHDSRRDRGTRLVEVEGYTPSQAIMVTGHATVHEFERTYLKQNPQLFRLGPQKRAERIAA